MAKLWIIRKCTDTSCRYRDTEDGECCFPMAWVHNFNYNHEAGTLECAVMKTEEDEA